MIEKTGIINFQTSSFVSVLSVVALMMAFQVPYSSPVQAKSRVRDVILRKLNNETYVLNRKRKLDLNIIEANIRPVVIKSVKRIKVLDVVVRQGGAQGQYFRR
ncbi:MAG: hypothetical protein QGG84_09970 [Rhodospirillales bacterium]|nr:hypothetical protein [Rhodospirillales bacterium]